MHPSENPSIVLAPHPPVSPGKKKAVPQSPEYFAGFFFVVFLDRMFLLFLFFCFYGGENCFRPYFNKIRFASIKHRFVFLCLFLIEFSTKKPEFHCGDWGSPLFLFSPIFRKFCGKIILKLTFSFPDKNNTHKNVLFWQKIKYFEYM